MSSYIPAKIERHKNAKGETTAYQISIPQYDGTVRTVFVRRDSLVRPRPSLFRENDLFHFDLALTTADDGGLETVRRLMGVETSGYRRDYVPGEAAGFVEPEDCIPERQLDEDASDWRHHEG